MWFEFDARRKGRFRFAETLGILHLHVPPAVACLSHLLHFHAHSVLENAPLSHAVQNGL
jgi:hypothetical protein